jgi:hypothetical protein
MPVDDLLPPEARLNYSTEERSNSVFLTKILAGKLPLTWLKAEISFPIM